MVAEYQGSSIPFVTSSHTADEVGSTTPVEVQFPGVTRWIEIRNTGHNALRVGFTSNGVLGEGAVTGSNPVDGHGPFGAEGFAANNENKAVHHNYFTIPTGSDGAGSSTRWEIKCTKVFFLTAAGTSDFSLIAGITNIPKNAFVHLSGSDGWQGVG